MSSRLDPSWTVLTSHENVDGSRCVDVFQRLDGTFGFEEFRREPEDRGAWTPLSYFSVRRYTNETAARDSARALVPWLEGE